MESPPRSVQPPHGTVCRRQQHSAAAEDGGHEGGPAAPAAPQQPAGRSPRPPPRPAARPDPAAVLTADNRPLSLSLSRVTRSWRTLGRPRCRPAPPGSVRPTPAGGGAARGPGGGVPGRAPGVRKPAALKGCDSYLDTRTTARAVPLGRERQPAGPGGIPPRLSAALRGERRATPQRQRSLPSAARPAPLPKPHRLPAKAAQGGRPSRRQTAPGRGRAAPTARRGAERRDGSADSPRRRRLSREEPRPARRRQRHGAVRAGLGALLGPAAPRGAGAALGPGAGPDPSPAGPHRRVAGGEGSVRALGGGRAGGGSAGGPRVAEFQPLHPQAGGGMAAPEPVGAGLHRRRRRGHGGHVLRGRAALPPLLPGTREPRGPAPPAEEEEEEGGGGGRADAGHSPPFLSVRRRAWAERRARATARSRSRGWSR